MEVGSSAWGGDVSVGDDMFRGGIVVPKVIGWGAALVGLTLVAGGVDLYYDLRGRVDRLSDRMAAVEEAGPSQTQALNAIRDEMARTSNEIAGLRANINILLQDRWRGQPGAPGGQPYP